METHRSKNIASQALGSHRQLLVQCATINQQGLSSVRYIEQTLYSLWEHLVSSRHGLSITGTSTCLWVPDSDVTTASLFGIDGRGTAVTRIQLQTYCPADGITCYQQRFVPHNQLEIVLPLLQAHWAHDRANQHLQLESGDVYTNQRHRHVA
jgi:hypothetical protein